MIEMSEPRPGTASHGAARFTGGIAVEETGEQPVCMRCGYEVISRPWGYKNPCPNCHFVYPLGDCSD